MRRLSYNMFYIMDIYVLYQVMFIVMLCDSILFFSTVMGKRDSVRLNNLAKFTAAFFFNGILI